MLSAVLLDMSANASFCFSRPSLTFSLFSRHLSVRAARAACQAARACQATLLCVNNPALQRVGLSTLLRSKPCAEPAQRCRRPPWYVCWLAATRTGPRPAHLERAAPRLP